jgi:serine/threonine protein kinase
VRVIGKGGMGMVYEAIDTVLNRSVAMKVLHPTLASQPSAKERFLREARFAASINHEHAIVLHHVGEHRDLPYFVMELLRGQSLEDRLREDSFRDYREVGRIAREIALGLAAAHEVGLIHRDIKPGNIWLETPNDKAKLMDFGIARSADEAIRLTMDGVLVGTPGYMSPEQARGEELDERSDLFSLGCVLYQMVTGNGPFDGPSAVAMLHKLTHEVPPRVNALMPGIPNALADLIARLLSKDRGERPASARLLADELNSLDLSTHAPKSPKAYHSTLALHSTITTDRQIFATTANPDELGTGEEWFAILLFFGSLSVLAFILYLCL